MNRLAVIADKVAKSVTAGVLISVKGYLPKDIYWVETHLTQSMRDFGHNVRITEDGSTDSSDFIGTINIYVGDETLVQMVKSRADDVLTHLGHMFRIIGTARIDVSHMFKQPVVRVHIEKNDDGEFASLTTTSITYSTWRSVLNWLGLIDEPEQAGSMLIAKYLEAYRTPGNFEGKQKEAMYARQIAEMAKSALKRGYREITWA